MTNPIYAELIGRSLGTNITNNHPTSHWIKLKFLLKADRTVGENTAFFKYVRYTKKVRTRQCRVPTGLLNVPHKSAICCNLVSDDGDDEIGELTLILDANLKVIDENWSIDLESPFVIGKIQPDLQHSD
ncbi:MAG: hypothetical protein HC789_14940 [Microcoleus sp. CSU_2_2]|nr:hypothetical protein [Microcoleus sp. CSU_2_2]